MSFRWGAERARKRSVLEKGARRINLYYFHVRPYSTSGSTIEGSNSDDSEDGCDSDTDSDEERNNTNVYDDDSDFIDELVERRLILWPQSRSNAPCA